MAKRCYTIIRVNDKTGVRVNMLRTPVSHSEAVTITKKLISPLPKHLRNVLEERRCGSTLGALPSWWPFGHKKAKRHPMSRTVYYERGPSGEFIPRHKQTVGRAPQAEEETVMAKRKHVTKALLGGTRSRRQVGRKLAQCRAKLKRVDQHLQHAMAAADRRGYTGMLHRKALFDDPRVKTLMRKRDALLKKC